MARSLVARSTLLAAAAAVTTTLAFSAPLHAELPKAGKGVQKAEPLKPVAPSSGTKRSGSTRDKKTVSGTVVSIDPAKGTALVQTRDGLVEVRARPTDAAMMKPGAKTELSVQKVGKELWLEQGAPSGIGSADVSQQPGMGAAASTENNPLFQQRGSTSGTVTEVDLEAGTFVVGGKKLTAHPDVLRGLKPGSAIVVDFGVVGESGWADRLYTAPAASAPAARAPSTTPAPDPDEAGNAPAPAPAPAAAKRNDDDDDDDDGD